MKKNKKAISTGADSGTKDGRQNIGGRPGILSEDWQI